MARISCDYCCTTCGRDAFKPGEVFGLGITGDTCMRCGGKIGTREELRRVQRKALGVTALEARVKDLEGQVAELQKALPQIHTYTCHNGQTHTFQVPPGRTLDEVMPVHPSTCKPKAAK